MTKHGWWLGAVGLASAGAAGLVHHRVLRIVMRDSWPPPGEAIGPDGALAAVERFAGQERAPDEVGLPYAWSTAATIDPWAEGATFYPRIRADVEGARSSIHILMFGWKPGVVGDELADILVQKLEAGVAVRILVDSYGSRPHGLSREMFERLAAAGAEIVVNNFLPPRLRGTYPDSRRLWTETLPGRADHRKLYVIDGATAWTGGAGIEDHFLDGRFHDVMVRLTGDVVRQAQSVFLTSFASHGGALPADLEPLFPRPVVAGTMPAALVQVVPGGFVAATQSAAELIDGAQHRLDIMNPYLTDRDMIGRIIAAATRGVAVRVVVSQRSNNEVAGAALRHRYGRLIAAGVQVWEYPGAVVHAKLIVADDRVQFGTLNLDAWALYRNFEIAVVAEDARVARRFRDRVFDPDIAMSRPGLAPSELSQLALGAVADRLTYLL